MKYLVLIFFLISFVSLSSLSISNAEARSLSPFMFELDESKVNDKLFFHVENGKSNFMVKNGETVTFPLVIISATSKPVSVDFHTTIGNEQMGSIKFPQGVNIRLEPSHMIMKPDVNQILNITVLVSEKAPSSKYDVKLVGVWKEEGKIPDFIGTSFSLHVGDDYDSDSINDKPSCGDSSSQVPLYGCGDLVTVRLDSPLKQFKSGIAIDEIKCKDSLVLLQKYDGSPACVKSDSFEKLYLRGWGDCAWNCSHPIPENIIEHSRKLAYLDKTMDVHGTDHSVKYRLDGNATVTDSIYSEDIVSVIITLDAITSGSLIIELPRTLIDSGHSNCDPSYEREDSFAVLIDNVEVRFEEIVTTSEKRTLSISFQENTKKIEIVTFCLI